MPSSFRGMGNVSFALAPRPPLENTYTAFGENTKKHVALTVDQACILRGE